MAEQNWAKLAEEIKKRRADQRLSQGDVARSADLSEATVRRIERQEVKDIQAATRVGLERALAWRDGTIDRILDGTVRPDDLTGLFMRSSGKIGGQMQIDVQEDGTETLTIAGPLTSVREDQVERLRRFGLQLAAGDSWSTYDGHPERFTRRPDGVVTREPVELRTQDGGAVVAVPARAPISRAVSGAADGNLGALRSGLGAGTGGLRAVGPDDYFGFERSLFGATAAAGVAAVLVGDLEHTPAVKEVRRLLREALGLLMEEQDRVDN